MKKLFYLLFLLSASVWAQVPPDASFLENLQITNNVQDNTATKVVVQNPDGVINWIPKNSLTETRQAINDANYTITGTNDQLVAYTTITADRTVTLPAATTANQRIWITDESGLCSNARRILVAPNGSDLIGGDSFAAITFPNGSGYLESNGAGKWNIISTTSIQFSAGVNTMPYVTDNANGSVTLATGVYSLFADSNGVGRPKAYQVAGGTFTLTDQAINYIYANYNTTTGLVSVLQTTVESTINNITTIPILRIFRDGTTLHIADYDNLGLALSNKTQRSFEKTQPYRFQAGEVLIGESATRIITVSSGTIWQGGNAITLASVASNVQTCYQFVNISGTWSKSVVTQYNNTQYNAIGGLATLGNTNSYAVNYVFRSVGSDTDIAFVLGTGDYSLGQAQTAPIPSNLPTFITSHMVFVGRIIVQKSINTATQIDSANTTGALFTTAGITDHNALNNLQTAQTGVTYGHLTDAPQTIAGVKTFSSDIVVNTISIGLGGGAIGNNTRVGFSALNYNTSGTGNTALGSQSLLTNSTGVSNTAIGDRALNANASSDSNTAVGFKSQLVSTAGFNTSVGDSSMVANVSGGSNVSIGANSFLNLTSGNSNVCLGTGAGTATSTLTPLTAASTSVFLGADCKANAIGEANQIVIGSLAVGNGSNTATIGNSSITDTYLQGQNLNIRNAAKTFWGKFTHTITAARTWTMPDVSGVVQVGVGYKVYTSLVSQSSTSAPTDIVLENTTGATATWSYLSAGVYRLTFSSAVLTTDKVVVFTTKNNSGGFGVSFTGNRASSTEVDVQTNNNLGVLDAQLTKASLEIRIYN